MKKVLIVASVASMIEQFNMDNIKILQELGYKVEVATNFSFAGTITDNIANSLKKKLEEKDVICHQVDFLRGIGSIKANKKAMEQLKKLKNKVTYDFVHCHSPIGGVLTRLVFKNSDKTKIIYTAHGFQFFKGGPKKDWILFYPVERYLAKYTDILITINKADYKIGESFGIKKVIYVPGVGIKWDELRKELDNISDVKKRLGISENSKVMISVGELSILKNHIVGIEAINRLKNNIDITYIICGVGDQRDILERKVKEYGLEKKVIFTGYSKNIKQYLDIADFSLFPSKREGLGLAGLEAMATGLPLVSSYLGGIKDYTNDGISGRVIENPNDVDKFMKAIEEIANLDEKEYKKIAQNNIEVSKKYSIKNVNKIMADLYSEM
ncbi:glycosyltransferase [Dellaglioa sp. BT-FLS60]